MRARPGFRTSPRCATAFRRPAQTPLGRIVNEYVALFEQFRDEEPAPERAPYPARPARLANELKANCYFLNASLAACCEIPAAAWRGAPIEGHRHALAILVEFGRDPAPDNLAADWVRGSEYDCALLRAAEIALISAAFLRRLGFSAIAHTRDRTEVSHARDPRWRPGSCTRTRPLPSSASGTPPASSRQPSPWQRTCRSPAMEASSTAAWAGGWGWTARRPGGSARSRRAALADGSRFPMEKIRRVAEPTTLILEDEVPRVPKRANFFTRALQRRPRREGAARALALRLQDADRRRLREADPRDGAAAGRAMLSSKRSKNTLIPMPTRARIKSLMYYLGADMVGVCEAKRYAWYLAPGRRHADRRPTTATRW